MDSADAEYSNSSITTTFTSCAQSFPSSTNHRAENAPVPRLGPAGANGESEEEEGEEEEQQSSE